MRRLLKKFFVFLFSILMFSGYIIPVYAVGDPYEYCNKVVMTVGSKTAYVNGKPKVMKAAPYIESGRVIVPLRDAAEFLDASVTWDGFMNGRTDVEAEDGMIVEFQAGDKRCYYGNLSQRKDTHANAGWVMQVMDKAPVIKKDNLMYVPIRYLVEGLGASLSYDEKTKTVVIKRIDTYGWREYTEVYTGTKIKYPYDWFVESEAFSLDIYKNGTEFIFTYEDRYPIEVISSNRRELLRQGWKVYRETSTKITLTKKYYDQQLTKIISTRKLKGGSLVYKVNTNSEASEWNLLIIDKIIPGTGI